MRKLLLKHLLQIIVSAFVLIPMIAIQSCSKIEDQKSNTISNQLHAKSSDITEILGWRPVTDSVYKMIKQLRYWDSLYRVDRLSNSITSIPAEQAIWMILANSNFDYANFNDSVPADVYSDFNFDLPIDTISSKSDSILFMPIDMVKAYCLIEDSILNSWRRGEYVQMVMIDISEITDIYIRVAVTIVKSISYVHIPILPANTTPEPINYVTQSLIPPLGFIELCPYLADDISIHINPISQIGSQIFTIPSGTFYIPGNYNAKVIFAWDNWPGTSVPGYTLGKIWAGPAGQFITDGQIFLDGAWEWANLQRNAAPGYVLWKVQCRAISNTPGFSPVYGHYYTAQYAQIIHFNNTP